MPPFFFAILTMIHPPHQDVLFGRGSVIAAHPGNQRLRSLVRQRKPQFIATKRQLKREIAYNIVDEILASGGRFVAEDIISAAKITKVDQQLLHMMVS